MDLTKPRKYEIVGHKVPRRVPGSRDASSLCRMTIIAENIEDALRTFADKFGDPVVDTISATSSYPLTTAALRWYLERTPRDALVEIGAHDLSTDPEVRAAEEARARTRELARPPISANERAILQAEAYAAVHSGVYAAFVPPGQHLVPDDRAYDTAGPTLAEPNAAADTGAIEHGRVAGEAHINTRGAIAYCEGIDQDAVPEPVEDSPSDLNELYGTEF